MNDALLALAQETQRRHAELISEAGKRTSTEARVEIRNDLDQLRQQFTLAALALTTTPAPFLWSPADPDHAVAMAIRADIADTEERLASLANNAAFQKLIKSDYGYSVVTTPKGTPLALGGVAIVVAILIVVLILK